MICGKLSFLRPILSAKVWYNFPSKGLGEGFVDIGRNTNFFILITTYYYFFATSVLGLILIIYLFL